MLAYNEANLLVEIGSCLGLWLGLSVVGLYDIAVLALCKSRSMFGNLLSGNEAKRIRVAEA